MDVGKQEHGAHRWPGKRHSHSGKRSGSTCERTMTHSPQLVSLTLPQSLRLQVYTACHRPRLGSSAGPRPANGRTYGKGRGEAALYELGVHRATRWELQRWNSRPSVSTGTESVDSITHGSTVLRGRRGGRELLLTCTV